MRQFISKNPINNNILAEFQFNTTNELQNIIKKSNQAYRGFKISTFKSRSLRLIKLSELIESNVDKYAKLITIEMGKPLAQAQAEVKKSAAYCRYYAENGDKYIKQERIKTEAKHSYVRYEPLGSIYVIGPFNFPFWLCFKPIIPQLVLGNTVLFRPSDSTGLTGLALEELFQEAGFDSGEFQNVFSAPNQLEEILSNKYVQGVSFTGSSKAGSIIGSIASKYLKRSVLELGGSDPFCVMREANIQLAVSLALKSRIANCGQVCFSAKRFIIHEAIYDKFRNQLVAAIQKINVGNPMDSTTDMGPLAREDLVINIQNQIQSGIKGGAQVLLGGEAISQKSSEGNYFQPTIVEVNEENCLAQEETFGPLFTLMKADSNDEIIKLANATQFGLGAVIVSQALEKDLQPIIEKLECGMVFVNEVVKSDSRLPSGGIKNSGYGRECGYWGVQNFMNAKTVWIQ